MIKLPLKLFYHFYIAPDDRGLFWNWWLDEFAQEILRAGLQESIKIGIHITMPGWWNEIHGIPIYANGSDNRILFSDKVQEYITMRYPFINIESIRDTGEKNLYEGTTLHNLWKYCKEHPTETVAYVHNKGVMSVGPHTKCWREVLNMTFINQWRDRFKDLILNDVTGLVDKQCDGTQLSGNFWWARASYINTLEKPIYEDRYQYEKWILSGNPRLNIIKNTGVDHFKEYYFRENMN